MKDFIASLIKLNRFFVIFEKALLAILLFSMIILSFGQVLARNLFSAGFVWIDQLLRLEVLWVAFIGAALAMEYNQHIKIDFLASIIRSSFYNKIMNLGAQLFAFAICFLLLVVASNYLYIVSSDSTSTIITGIPDWSFRCVIPYCFLMAAIRSLINIIKIYHGKDFHNV